MGLWDAFLSIFETSKPRTMPIKKKSSTSQHYSTWGSRNLRNNVADLSLHFAIVDYIHENGKFAKVKWGGYKGFLPISEICKKRIDSVREVISEGQRVEICVIESSTKHDDEYVVSMALVDEVKQRKELGKLNVESRIQVAIKRVEYRRVKVEYTDKVFGYVYKDELSYFGRNECKDLVSLGDILDVEVIELILPSDWIKNKKNRNSSHFIASARKCLPPREVKIVPCSFSTFPFIIEVRVKLPKEFDPVVKFVFECIVDSNSILQINQSMRLPEISFNEIIAILQRLELITNDGFLTNKGQQFALAIQRCNEYNSAYVEGYFVSAAPPRMKFLSIRSVNEIDYPSGYPIPLIDNREIDDFIKATEEELPSIPFGSIADENEKQRLSEIIKDNYLRVFLRKKPDCPMGAVTLDVDQDWLLSFLWKRLVSCDEIPQEYVKAEDEASLVRMVMYDIYDYESEENVCVIYYEPITQTFWCPPPRSKRRARFFKHKEDVFPILDSECVSKINKKMVGTNTFKLVPNLWITME